MRHEKVNTIHTIILVLPVAKITTCNFLYPKLYLYLLIYLNIYLLFFYIAFLLGFVGILAFLIGRGLKSLIFNRD